MANFPIDFPLYAPATERLVLDRVQSATESPYSKKVQVVHQASQWKLMWSWPRMTIPRAETIAAWGLSLQGMIGSFKFYPNRTIVSALMGRSVAVKAFATNNAVSVGGWAAGALSTLRVGQWLTIGTQLLRVTEAAAVADANGRVTVTFEPALRSDFAAGTGVEFVKPFGVFRLASSDSPAYTLDPDRKPEFGTIEAREVV